MVNIFNENTMEDFTLILLDKSLKKRGVINNTTDLQFTINYNSAQEASCTVYKYLNDVECNNWDKLVDFGVVYLKETDENYEMTVQLDEENVSKKTLTLTSLCEAELSAIKLFDIEINTDDDIAREDYTIPSVLYNEKNPKTSILNRLLEKAPHYTIGHVDSTIKNIQRSFSFDDKSIYDALMDIAEEIKCLFVFDSKTRTINCYDLLSYCRDCGERDDMDGVCPKCGSKNIEEPYGEDTGIYIDTFNLAEQISVTKDTDNVFNTLKLKAGDELMTSSIRTINPNGTDYLYYINEETLANMPKTLADKLVSYNELLDEYNKNYILNINDDDLIEKYNAIVKKYNNKDYAQYKYDEDNEKVLTNNSFIEVDKNTKGYANLISLYYDVIDFSLYLESSLMPTIIKEAKSAKEDIENLNEDNLGILGLASVKESTNQTTVENGIKALCKLYLYANYKITVNTSTYDYIGDDGNTGFHYGEWEGIITLQSYKDSEDMATTSIIRIKVTDDIEKYLNQKVKKQILSSNETLGGIYDLIGIDISDSQEKFKNAVKYYSLNRITSFYDAYRAALDVLIDADQASENADFYNALYVPYYTRWNILNDELELRKAEIDLINDMDNVVNGLRVEVQKALNFQEYLGDDWTTFCSYRRESTYENQNYISTGLTNSELIDNANKFMNVAKKQSIEAGTPQITITISMKNIYLLKEFKKLINNFKVGNWIRAKCDGDVYKLRLIKIQIDYNDIQKCGVEFSTLKKKYNCLSDTQEIIDQAKSISSSYSYYTSQVDKSKESMNVVDNWIKNGFDASLKIYNNNNNQKVTFDENGLLVRGYDDIDEIYYPEQLKMLNAGIVITDDNWKTVKTAIGKINYQDPITGEIKTTYGVNAETIIGQFILGQNLNLYSESGYNTLSFDDNGLYMLAKPVNGKYSDSILNIKKQEIDGSITNLISINDNGDLDINSSSLKSKVETSDYNGQTIASLINQSADTIQIDANHINLNGVVTANNYFKINTDGSMKAIAGNIGGFDITKNSITSEKTLNKRIYHTDLRSDNMSLIFINRPAGASETIKNDEQTSATYDSSGVFYNYEYYNSSSQLINNYTVSIGNNGEFAISDVFHGNYMSQTFESINFIKGGDTTIKIDGDSGNIKCYSLTQTSDKRYKTNIEFIDNLYDVILNELKPCIYSFKKDINSKYFGFIAQDVQEIIDKYNLDNLSLIKEDDNGYLSLNYIQFIPILVKGYQEQQKQIEQLKQQIVD